MLGDVIYARLSADATIAAKVGTRIQPRSSPQSADLPRITYLQVSGTRIDSMDGPSGLGIYRVQIEIWAASYQDADDIAKALKKASKAGGPLDGLIGTVGSDVVQACYKEDEADLDEIPRPGGEQGTYHRSMDFELWLEE